MSSVEDRYEAIAEVAAAWRDPDHPPRAEAVAATIDAPNRWTEEALNYALNRWMQRITTEALEHWLGSERTAGGTTVGVLHGASDPMDGFRDLLAVVATDQEYVGSAPEASPALMPAFGSALADRLGDGTLDFDSRDEVLERSDALMAQPPSEEVESLREECNRHGLSAERVFIHPARVAVAVLDGNESKDERDRLAEDLLLYEGGGHRLLAILWAPRDLEPDPYLQAMARFRGTFPGHPDTPGALQMKKAFLDGQDEPHAYAAGLEFLVSRGAPEPQSLGHFRWSEYDDFADVTHWLETMGGRVSAVVARASLHERLVDALPLRTPGDLHTPPLDDDEGLEIMEFVRSLA